MTYPPPEAYPPPEGYPPHEGPPPTVPAYQPATAPLPNTSYRPPDQGRSDVQGRSTVLVLLSGAAGLLLVFGVLMLVLFLNARGTVSDTKANLRDTRADLTAQVKEQKSIVTDRQEKLAQAEKRANDLNTQLGATKTNLTDMTAQRNVLVPCMRRIQDAFDAAANGDSSGVTRALRQARRTCDKAEIKVDS